jgi:hypothetical protein
MTSLQSCCLLIATSMLAASPAAIAQTCGEWEVTPTTAPGVFNDVAATPARAWAVGNRGAWLPIAQHFDGKSWQSIVLPNFASLGNQPDIYGVSIAPTGNDVWLAGSINVAIKRFPMALRHRNGSFDRVEIIELQPATTYPYAERGGAVRASHAFDDDDVWVVGYSSGNGDGLATTLFLTAHFDGSQWNEHYIPGIANRSHEFQDVHGAAPDDVWAVGNSRNNAGAYTARTYHFDGSAWTHIPNPAIALAPTFLNAVYAAGPDDAWTGGSINYSTPIMMHFDGDEWSMAQLPAGLGQGEIRELSGTSSSDVWAIFEDMSSQPILLHFDGKSWSIAAEQPPAGGAYVRALAAIEPCHLWTVGGNAAGPYAVRLQDTTQPMPGDVNGDGSVNVDDLIAVILAWGPCPAPPAACQADVNGSGSVDADDLVLVILLWS